MLHGGNEFLRETSMRNQNDADHELVLSRNSLCANAATANAIFSGAEASKGASLIRGTGADKSNGDL
jgi:hypothetical protein